MASKTERLEYATSTSPLGPFTVKGVIMDESPTGCWTNHHSLVQVKNQWYLFYHHNDLSPKFDKSRSVRIDSLSFAADGAINKVIPSLRGVGLTDAHQKIQLDRYSRLIAQGATVAFLGTADTFRGWQTVFSSGAGWVQYNGVSFGKQTPKTITVRARSATGGILQVRLNGASGPVIAQVNISKGTEWKELNAPVVAVKAATQNLIVSPKTDAAIAVDWLRFN